MTNYMRKNRKGSMVIKSFIGAICSFLVVAPFNVGADIVSADWKTAGDNLITHDTVSELYWLDLTKTNNLSYDYVSRQLDSGGDFEGWRYATNAEVVTLWNNFGIDLSASAPADAVTGYNDPLITSTAPILGDVYGEFSPSGVGSLGITGTASKTGLHSWMGAYNSTQGATDAQYLYDGRLEIEDARVEVHTGSWLVRKNYVPTYVEFSQKKLSDIISLNAANTTIGNIYIKDLLDFLAGATSRTEEAIWPYEKEVNRYIKEIDKSYKSSLKRTKKEKKSGFFIKSEEQYKEVLRNTKLHYRSLKSQFKNEVIPKIKIKSAQKIIMTNYVSKKDIDDHEMIFILAQAMTEKPRAFKYRKRFSVKRSVTDNVDWLIYEYIVDNKRSFYGHALIFRDELFKKMSSIDKKIHQIEWIGGSNYLPHEQVPNEINRYSITSELAFGANKNKVIDGLTKKFKINKNFLQTTSNCLPVSIPANSVDDAQYVVDKSIIDNRSTVPFSFIKNISNWGGYEITKKMRKKYPDIFSLKKCFISIEGKDRSTDIRAKLTKNLGLIDLSVRLNKDKLIPKELFIASGEKNWGDKYKINNNNHYIDTLTLKYPRLKVVLKNDKDNNKSQVIYTMSMHGDTIEEGHAYSSKMYYSNTYLNIENYDLMAVIPFELIKTAKDIENYINDITKLKSAETLNEFSL